MDPVPIAAGMAIWLITAVAYAAYRLRQRSSRFTSGSVVELRELSAAEGIAWHPLVRYRNLDGGVGVFQSSWGTAPQRWRIGEPVTVKIYDGKPEIYEPQLVRVAVAAGIVLGGVMVLGPFLTLR